MSEPLLDRAGRRRSPATMPGFRAGRAPGNKGLRYPADPPKIEEIIVVMRAAAAAHCSFGAARAGAAAKSAWTHGDGNSFSPGSTCGASSRSVRCCASSTARRAAATGHLPRHAPSCGAPPPPQEYGAGLPHTSSGTPTPSRWHAKAYR